MERWAVSEEWADGWQKSEDKGGGMGAGMGGELSARRECRLSSLVKKGV